MKPKNILFNSFIESVDDLLTWHLIFFLKEEEKFMNCIYKSILFSLSKNLLLFIHYLLQSLYLSS